MEIFKHYSVYLKTLTLLSMALLWGKLVCGQTIVTTSLIPDIICEGNNIDVSFNSTGTFNAGNFYTAQLSDASGSFATFTNIGTITGLNGLYVLPAVIPLGTPGSFGYKIRVVSSDPVDESDPGQTVTIIAFPTIMSINPGSICGSGTVTLGATSSAGTINWYDVSTGGSSLGTGTSFTTPAISATTSYYVDAFDNGCTSVNRTEVVATVNTIPTIIGTTPGSICGSGTVTLGATASAGTINWYDVSAGGSSLGTGTSFTTPTISATTSYYIDAFDNGCTSVNRTEVVATVNTIPTIIGTTPGSICGSGTVTLGATASAETINWYDVSTGGSSLGTGTSFTTPAISATTSYYVDAFDNGCTSVNRTEVVATVNTIPTIIGTTPGSICGSGTVTLGATASAGTINWYDVSTGGSSLGTGTSFTTPTISATTNYYVDALDNGCTSVNRTEVVATVNTIPTIIGTTPGSICGNGTVTLGATASAGTINWYDVSTGGSNLGTGTSFTTPSISTTTKYYVDATNLGCTTVTRIGVSATIDLVPAAATAPVNGSRCGTGTEIISATNPIGTTIDWYDASTNGTFVGSGTSITTPSISVTTIYYAEVRNTTTGCLSSTRTSVTLTINPLPVTPTGIVASPASICNGASSIISVTDPGIGYTTDWYTLNCGGVPVTGGIGVSSLSVSPASTTIYYALTRNITTSCVSSCAQVTVTVDVPAAAPSGIVASPSTICNGASSTISVTDPGIGYTTDWYTVSCGGTPVVGGAGMNSLSVSPTSSTNYYARTTNTSTSCVSACEQVTVSVNLLPTAIITGAASFCSGGNTLLSSTATAGSGSITGYQWNLAGSPIIGATTATYTAAATGSYTITISNSNGCSFTSNAFLVTDNALPTATITGTASFCTGGNTLLSSTATAGSGSITDYQWNMAGTPIIGATTATYTATATGSYTVTISNSNGCSFTSNAFLVTVNAIPIANITGTASFCAGSNTLLSSNALAGSGSITSYQWNLAGSPIIGATTATYTAATGSYTVTISNSNGCTFTSNAFLVTVNALPTATITGTASFCAGGNTLLSSNALAGSGSITSYQWNLAGSPIIGATTATYTAAATGSYTVTISNSNGCSFTSNAFLVTVNAIPIANITGTASFCAGSNTLLSSNALAGSGSITGYQWNLAGSPIIGATTATYPASAVGSYTVAISNSNGCSITSNAFLVTVNALPTATIIGTASFCAGGNTLLSSIATSGSGSITNYQWNLGGLPISGATAATYSASAAGSYTVTISNSNGCSFTSSAFLVTVNAIPTANITGTASFCTFGNTILTSNAAAGSGSITSYQWNLAGVPISGAISTTYLTSVAGSYTVTISNNSGCMFTSNAFLVTVNALPTATITGMASFCTGGNTLLISNASAGSGSISGYQWNLEGTPISGAVASTYTAFASGSYTVTISNSDGCLFTSNAFPVILNTLPSAIITGTASFCAGGNTLLTSNATAGSGSITNSQWNLGGVPISGATALIYSASAAGSYSITITNSNGCSYTSNSFPVTVNSLPLSPTTNVTVQPTCSQPTGTIVITTPTIGLTFKLDGSAYAAYPAGGYTLVSPGIHTLTAQNSSNCISTVTNVTVNPVPNGPSALVTTTSSASCGLSNGTITLGAVTGGTAPFTFSINASAYTALTSYTGMVAGPYNIQVKDDNGCIFSTSVTISNTSGPTSIIATPTNASCGLSNGTITIGIVTGGSTPYTYSVDASSYSLSKSYSGLAAGPHIVQVKDANGCIYSTSVTIINASGPTAIVAVPTNATCTLSNGTITLGSVTGGTAPYIYSVDASAYSTSTSYSGLAAGSHSVQVKDANGCNFSSSVTITDASGPSAIVVIPANTTCGLNNGLIALGSVTGGTVPYTFSVDASAFTTSVSYPGLTSGSHNIQVKDANGCIFSTSTTISNLSGPTAILSTSVSSTCGLSNGTITLGIVSGGTAPYTYSVDASAYTASTFYPGLIAGPHSVQVKDVNSCTFLKNVTVNNVSGPTAIVATSSGASCGLSNGTITLGAVTEGFAPFTYSVDASAFTVITSYSGLAAGLHSIQVKDANACILDTNVNIINASGPTAIVAISTNASCGLSNGIITLGDVTGGSAPYTYSVDISAFTTSTSYPGLVAGSHNVQVKDANGCIFSTSISINNASGPTAIAVTPSNASCGQNNGSITLGAVTGGSAPYTYSLDASAYTTSTSYTSLAAGSHGLEVKDVNGCIYSSNITINNVSGPTAIVATPLNASCGQNNGIIILGDVSGGTSPFTFSVDASAFTASTTYSGMSAGQHTVLVKDANGCIFFVGVNISNTSGPTAIANTPVNASCGLSNGTITLGVVSGGTSPYTFSIDGSPFTLLTFYSNLVVGLHNLQVKDANGCIFSTSFTIGNVNGPSAIVAIPSRASCGQNNGTISMGAVTGGTSPYTYSVDGSSYTSSTSFSNLAAGLHSIKVMDANGCIISTNISISNVSGPIDIAVMPASASCGLNNGTISIGVVTGGTAPYTYAVDTSAFTSSTSYSNLVAGLHNVQVKDASGCIFLKIVTINSANGPTAIAAMPSNTSCGKSNGTVILGIVTGGTSPFTYSVDASSFTTSKLYNGLATGLHDIKVKDGNGCIFSTSVTIIEDANTMNAPITGSVTQPSCTLATGSVILSGLPELNWTINPGSVTGTGSSVTISGLDSGTYNFTVTNIDGCISPASADVVITPSPHPIAHLNYSSACIGIPTLFSDQSVSSQASLIYWNWIIKDNLQTIGELTGQNSSFTFENKGKYSVTHTITNSAGCSDSIIIEISVAPLPVSAFTITNNFENFEGQIILVNETIGADEYFWDFGNGETSTLASPTATYNEDGDYLIQLFSKDSYGCVDSSSITYTIQSKGLWVPNALALGNAPSVGLWKPVGANLKTYEAKVYNRWGLLIWSSDKLTDGAPSEGWDGTYNGATCEAGIYMWKISATFKDGTKWPDPKIDYRQNLGDGGFGTITLIK